MNNNTKGLITLIVLAAIVVFVIVYALSMEPPGTKQYITGAGSFEIQKLKNDIGYRIKIYVNNNPYYITTRYAPDDVKDIAVEGSLKSYILSKNQTFITIDPYEGLKGKATIAALEIDKILDNKFLFNMPVNSAFTVPFNEAPVKTCSDADEATNVFLLKLGEANRPYRNKDCIIFEGETEDNLIKLADRFVFHLLGILP